MRIAIIGVGHVGATLAYTLLCNGLADEVLLVNRTAERAVGEAADLEHAEAFLDRPASVRAVNLHETAGSDLVILTLSVSADRPGREHFAQANGRLFRETVPLIARLSPGAILLVVTNPVEALTQYAIELSGFEPRRVLGTGTLIDSARFRSALSRHLQIHPDDLRAYIIGEHGDSQFPVLSGASAGGIHLGELPTELVEQSRQSSHEVFRRKGYTNFAISQAAGMIVRSIVEDQRRTLPVSTLIEDYVGVRDVVLSIPCVVGRQGVMRQLHPSLAETEIQQFQACAQAVRETLRRARARESNPKSEVRNPDS